MIQENSNVKYPVNAVPLAKFAELIGKTHDAVKQMAKHGKLPIIEFSDPSKKKTRAGEVWVNITAFNKGVDDAFSNRPIEQRDAWLLWLNN